MAPLAVSWALPVVPSSSTPLIAVGGVDEEGTSARADSTSALTIRPPGPLPFSPSRSTPVSRATRRANGEALTLGLFPADAAGDTVGGTVAEEASATGGNG